MTTEHSLEPRTVLRLVVGGGMMAAGALKQQANAAIALDTFLAMFLTDVLPFVVSECRVLITDRDFKNRLKALFSFLSAMLLVFLVALMLRHFSGEYTRDAGGDWVFVSKSS